MPASSPNSSPEDAASPQGVPTTSCVVVDYSSGKALDDCVASLEAEGVADITVVDNAAAPSRPPAPMHNGSARVTILRPGSNLGYGGGANYGARYNAGTQPPATPYLLVVNPDTVVKAGAIAALERVLEEEEDVAIVGPMLRETTGDVYPTGRDFPDLGEAIGHGFVGLFWGGNPWTLRYRRIGSAQHHARDADWVSGAFFLVRRDAFDSVGGFDEAYFMYMEDVDLCWRLRRAGWRVRYEPAAEVVHEQGRSTSRHPYRMLAAHHRSMWRFAQRSTSGRQRVALPLIAGGLALRLVLAWTEHLVGARSRVRALHG